MFINVSVFNICRRGLFLFHVFVIPKDEYTTNRMDNDGSLSTIISPFIWLHADLLLTRGFVFLVKWAKSLVFNVLEANQKITSMRNFQVKFALVATRWPGGETELLIPSDTQQLVNCTSQLQNRTNYVSLRKNHWCLKRHLLVLDLYSVMAGRYTIHLPKNVEDDHYHLYGAMVKSGTHQFCLSGTSNKFM